MNKLIAWMDDIAYFLILVALGLAIVGALDWWAL